MWEKYYSNGKLPDHIKMGSFWWRDILKLLDTYKGIAAVNLQDGITCRMWIDMWHGMVPSQAYPELFSFARKKTINVQDAKMIEDIDSLFQLPISLEAFHQLELLLSALEQSANSEDMDIWSYIQGAHFSSSKAYKQLTGFAVVHPAYKWIWKSVVQHKHIVLIWLLLKNRLSTRAHLRMKNMVLPSYHCILCTDSVEESIEHLFMHCRFAQECWHILHLQVSGPNDPFQSFEDFRAQLDVPQRAGILALILVLGRDTKNYTACDTQALDT